VELIAIDLGNRTEYGPGEPISGEVSWQLDAPPAGVEVRLFWYTRGKGTTDVQVVKAQHFDSAGTAGRRKFKFVLPEEPYSFSGKLISLVWALEAVVQPGNRSQRLELVVAPGGREVLLGAEAPRA
jgi:hypothetical protein